MGGFDRRRYLQELIRACGGTMRFSRAVGVTRQAVSLWMQGGGIVPPGSAMRVAPIARAHGVWVTAEQLAGVEPLPGEPPPTGTDDQSTGAPKRMLRVVRSPSRRGVDPARVALEMLRYDAQKRRTFAPPVPGKPRNNWPMSPVELRPAA